MDKPTSRLIPARIDGYGPIRPFTGAFDNLGVVKTASARICSAVSGHSKILPGIEAAIEACGLRDGGVISFHHYLRNGDPVLSMVLAAIALRGLKDITIAPSSLFPVHAPLV